MGKYRWIATDDLLNDDYYEPVNFDEYEAATKNPGFSLLLITFIFCVGTILVAIVRPIKVKEEDVDNNKMGYISIDNHLTVRTRKSLRGKNRYGRNHMTIQEPTSETVTTNRTFHVSQGLGKDKKEIGKYNTGARLEFDDLLPFRDKFAENNEHKTDNHSTETGQTSAQRGIFRLRVKKLYRWFKSLGCVICYFDFSKLFKSRPRIGSKTCPSITPTVSSDSKSTKSNEGRSANRKIIIEQSTTENCASKSVNLDERRSTTVASTLEEVITRHSRDNNVTPAAKPSLDEKSDDESSVSSLEDAAVEDEMEEIINLAVPWTILDIIGDCSDFFIILVISHYMGTAAMICYSTVDFILGSFNILCSGIYGSCYKHVNNACADGSNHLAGEYIQISIFLNTIISAPSYVLAVMYMPMIMTYYGYADTVIDMSQNYAALAALHDLVEGGVEMLGTVLDIDGHATFNAVWGTWESLISVITSVVVIKYFNPSILGLAIYYFVESVIVHSLYIYVAYYKRGWLDKYIDGIVSKTALKNNLAIMSILKRSIPLLIDDATVTIEWLVLSFFAAYQGSAEAIVWILFSYIWEIVELIPENFADATTARVAYLLSVGNINVAKVISGQAMFITTAASIFLSVSVMVYRHFIVWCISVDEALEQMLLELLPYVAFCQPFIAIGMTAAAINEGLCMYSHVVKKMILATCLVTIPVAALLTYKFQFNLEGLTAAVCMGYVTGGALNFNMFMNADWDRAVRKNQEIVEYGK